MWTVLTRLLDRQLDLIILVAWGLTVLTRMVRTNNDTGFMVLLVVLMAIVAILMHTVRMIKTEEDD